MPPALSAPIPGVLPGGSTGVDGEHTASRVSDTHRIVKAATFCELGACGLPARGPFTTWLVAFVALREQFRDFIVPSGNIGLVGGGFLGVPEYHRFSKIATYRGSLPCLETNQVTNSHELT